MGLAASQARYLGLTARKTNVEYEGQQINQARTALANQSANLFNELLTLSVPTPPSSADYTTLQYSYKDGTVDETITSMVKLENDPDYNYRVTHYHYENEYQGIQKRVAYQYVTYDTSGNPIKIGTKTLTQYAPSVPRTEIDEAYDRILADQPQFQPSPTNPAYYYLGNDGNYYFETKNDIFASDQTHSDLTVYYATDNKVKKEKTERAVVEFDQSGRAQAIQLENTSAVFTLTSETITDENAYNDAMNQYTYDMAVYEKKVQDINAKTQKIQEQDRTLELQLRQLDTEQEALQTEMESIKKVIEKNISNTFNTFSSGS